MSSQPSIDRVCAACFDDDDIRRWIRALNGSRGCDACGHFDSPTAPLDDLCEYLVECLGSFWGSAADQLPYESREGGYQGVTWDTEELVFDEVGLGLPRDDSGKLHRQMSWRLVDDKIWCDYDWLRLDEDKALNLSWDQLCEKIRHQRRFFFQTEKNPDPFPDPDHISPSDLLKAIALSVDKMGLLSILSPSTELYRARTRLSKKEKLVAETFGAPPAEKATQSNRMNPAGIPMFYSSEKATTAVREVRARSTLVGKFEVAEKIRILNLADLPLVPGIFSNPTRDQRLTLRFLHQFLDAIMQPVDRDERAHIDYIPSQVVTEYLRDFVFKAGSIRGIRFPSTLHSGGRNVVLFVGGADADSIPIDKPSVPAGIHYISAKRVTLKTGKSRRRRKKKGG